MRTRGEQCSQRGDRRTTTRTLSSQKRLDVAQWAQSVSGGSLRGAVPPTLTGGGGGIGRPSACWLCEGGRRDQRLQLVHWRPCSPVVQHA